MRTRPEAASCRRKRTPISRNLSAARQGVCTARWCRSWRRWRGSRSPTIKTCRRIKNWPSMRSILSRGAWRCLQACSGPCGSTQMSWRWVPWRDSRTPRMRRTIWWITACRSGMRTALSEGLCCIASRRIRRSMICPSRS